MFLEAWYLARSILAACWIYLAEIFAFAFEEQRSEPEVPISRAKRKKKSKRVLFSCGVRAGGGRLLNLSDLMTPIEEEMLRCLCAKGYALNEPVRKLPIISDVCISRDAFTNAWINSCGT